MAYDLFKQIITSINLKTGNLFDEDYESADAAYNPYIVNMCFSYGGDTLLFANEMNQRPWMSHKQQYDFYYNIVPKGKRYNKWVKAEDINNLEAIMEVYDCTSKRAKEYLAVFTPEQIEVIKELTFKGDISNEKRRKK